MEEDMEVSIDSVIWEWTKKQMEFLYFLVLTLHHEAYSRSFR